MGLGLGFVAAGAEGASGGGFVAARCCGGWVLVMVAGMGVAVWVAGVGVVGFVFRWVL
uniref:Uncharacterized protein n=1 Tax=Fagus sylvatica TaxID=28930 RepID=A0A2N9GDW6_FAGSY